MRASRIYQASATPPDGAAWGSQWVKVRTLLFLPETHARHALPKMYVPYAAADIDVRKKRARRRENAFQGLLMTFIMHHHEERAAHAKSLAAHLHRCDVRTPQAKFEGERTCRPAHASATCAYARDQNHELGAPCPLAQAVGATCARSSVTFILGVAPRRSLDL